MTITMTNQSSNEEDPKRENLLEKYKEERKEIHIMILECNKGLRKCDKEIETVNKRLDDIYKQYDVKEMDRDSMGVQGANLNRATELKIKLVRERTLLINEKSKLIELLHKILSEQQQLEISAELALMQIKEQMGDDDDNDLYQHHEEPEFTSEEEAEVEELYRDNESPN